MPLSLLKSQPHPTPDPAPTSVHSADVRRLLIIRAAQADLEAEAALICDRLRQAAEASWLASELAGHPAGQTYIASDVGAVRVSRQTRWRQLDHGALESLRSLIGPRAKELLTERTTAKVRDARALIQRLKGDAAKFLLIGTEVNPVPDFDKQWAAIRPSLPPEVAEEIEASFKAARYAPQVQVLPRGECK